MPENKMVDFNELIRFYNPQTLADVCRLRQLCQSTTPVPETVRLQLNRMCLRIYEDPSKRSDYEIKLNEVKACRDFREMDFLTEGKTHKMINVLVEELQHLDCALKDYEAPSRCTSLNQMTNEMTTSLEIFEREAEDIKSIRKDPTKIYDERRTMKQKFLYRHTIIVREDGSTCKVTSMVIIYNNCFDCLEGEYIYAQFVLLNIDINIMDCKFHVYPILEHTRKWEYTICERKLDVAPTAKSEVQNICAQMKTKSSVHEVDNGLNVCDSSSITQEHEKAASDGKCRRPSSENYSFDKKKKKAHGLSFWHLLLGFLCLAPDVVNAGVLGQVEVKEVLISKRCNQQNFYSMKQSCHADENAHKLTLDNCDFKKLCGTDEHPVCLDTEEMGVYVCLRTDLTCEKGRKVKAWQDNQLPGRLYLQEVDCPIDSYQPTKSDCIHACLFPHRNVSDMPDMYIWISECDNINPCLAYCNFKNGFFNSDGILIVNYDQYVICSNVKDYNPCKEGKIPLPDGLCVSECEDGFERTPPDFHCRLSDKAINIAPAKTESDTAKVLPTSTSPASTTHHSPITMKTMPSEILNIISHGGNTHFWIVVIALMMILAAVVGVLVKKHLNIRIGRNCSREVQMPEYEGLGSIGCGVNATESKPIPEKHINKMKTTTVNKTYINFHSDTANVNFNKDLLTDCREDIQDTLLSLTERKAIKEDADTVEEIVVL